ncbi:MAG: dienelactone hydrolase family protein [Ignavibacteriaceae bacterium]|nr:dienelactone hydrolase family protein [Ignavibacteriaceae bacterium]
MRTGLGFFIVLSIIFYAGITMAGNISKQDDNYIETSTVTYVSGTDTVSAYLAVPKGEGKYPALIVIHEWWGLTPWMKSNADSFAKKGYIALAVDLYRGKSTSDPKEAMELVKNFSKDRAIVDLKAAYDYLSNLQNVDNQKIGSIGWCFGGGYSFQAALNIPQLKMCIINYGTVSSDEDVIRNIHCPVLCIHGDEDKAIPPDSIKAFDKAAKSIGLNVDVEFFPGMGHAFMNPGNSGYKQEIVDMAWKDIYEFLDKNLKN